MQRESGAGRLGRGAADGARAGDLHGGEAATTNNRMELTAAIEALEALSRPVTVELHTDSKYVQNGITKWLALWKRAAGAP